MNIWNPGCGKGFETYSITALLAEKFPDRMIKVWANDIDLISISSAPNIVVRPNEIPEHLKSYSVEGRNGTSFKSILKDRIYFEYHDVLHASSLPDLDIIVSRDLLSFLKPEFQDSVLEKFYRMLKPSGILVLGSNEEPLDQEKWEKIVNDKFSAYRKIAE